MSRDHFKLYPSQASAQSDADRHEAMIELYIGEPIRAAIYRQECALAAQFNAAGIIPRIVMPSFDEWKKIGCA